MFVVIYTMTGAQRGFSNKTGDGPVSGNFFYRKLTIGSTITPIEANKGTRCLQKRIEKFPLVQAVQSQLIDLTNKINNANS